MKKKILKRIKAFTLIEILIIIIILSSLFFVVFFNITTNIKRARDSQRKASFHTMKNKLEEYYYAKNSYPTSLPSCNQPLVSGETTYVYQIPCDPKTKNSYTFVADESGNFFKLYAILEVDSDPIIEVLGCQEGCGPDCLYNYGVTSPNVSLDACSLGQNLYACSPGGGSEGHCDLFDDPEISECPKTYVNDPICQNECSSRDLRCKNSKGKHTPK